MKRITIQMSWQPLIFSLTIRSQLPVTIRIIETLQKFIKEVI